MVKRVVLAVVQREYAAKLAEYLREEEPGWDIAAYTHDSALRRELQGNGKIDLLIGQPELLGQVMQMCGKAGKIVALVDGNSSVGEHWIEIGQYQPLPTILSSIRGAIGLEAAVSAEGCQTWTVFSASGGTGKTTVALNLARQAGERGLRVFYFNLESLNATALLFGKGEPDSLSRLLYTLQTHPEQWDELAKRAIRHQPQLRADYIDAPEHPGERLALTPELTEEFLRKLKSLGRYDLIVIDPDSGADEWHRRLLEISDRVLWLTLDDVQNLRKTEKLLRYWHEYFADKMYKFAIVMNKSNGNRFVNRLEMPAASEPILLPYIPQWKTVDQPGRLLSVPAFAGAVGELLVGFAGSDGTTNGGRRRREGGYENERTRSGGVG
ncbi:AAA family ATPase [Cohnella terricola]|uniref:CobQ/CobB/MinD/ParA nucleotide binding domain-containing protein n=1 Tax=Cohnella terricola TaxID=1289167 RepID=A0A559JEB9_9BACL|nr:hypothetical protein [Cohnella terricola]TVX98216.1 hypothetical protein FPZ45_16075 [Cohnella terricola]